MNIILFPITYKCNLSCKYCPMKDAGREPNLDKCLELIKSSDCEWLYITGGEPLMVKRIEEICTKIRSFGKKVALSTNGTIDNDRLPFFVDRVGVSIDGDRKYHNEYRQGSYDKAVSFLGNMVNKVETVLMFTLFPENEHCIDSVKSLAYDLDVDHLQVVRGVA